jgi:hypothetical protein
MADYRLLGYTTYTAIKQPGPTADDGSNSNADSKQPPGLPESLENAEMTHDLEVGLMLRIDDLVLNRSFENPDTAVLLRVGGGASTLEPKLRLDPTDPNSAEALVSGHSPWFANAMLRFESNYESWGSGHKTRGFIELGFRWYGPFGAAENGRYLLVAGMSVPILQSGNRVAVFPHIQLDYPASGAGEMTNHRVGFLVDINLQKLFTSGI